MKSQLMYVELKSGYSDIGPAWIGKANFSKSGQTIYFNGQVFKKYNGISGNHYEVETGEEYWISGVKRNGEDRHWAGGGKIQIDKEVINEYLTLIDISELPKNKFVIVELDNEPKKLEQTDYENQKFEKGFDSNLRFKKPTELTDLEVEELLEYYYQIDLTALPKKSRKTYLESIKDLEVESEKRKKSLA